MMDPSSVYRRQDTMREICRRIGYQGRFVWLIPASTVPVLATTHVGHSRIRFRALNITDPPPYSYKRTTLRTLKLNDNTALCALPTLRSRRRDLLVFMTPERVKAQKWTVSEGNRISPEERAACLGQESFDASTMAVARAVCYYRGLIGSHRSHHTSRPTSGGGVGRHAPGRHVAGGNGESQPSTK